MNEATKWEELMNKVEDLDPELEAYLFREASIGSVIKHPLVYELLYDKQSNARLNYALKLKKEYLAKAQKKKNFSSYIMLHEKPWRFEALKSIIEDVKDREKAAELIHSVWIGSENIWQHLAEWKVMLKEYREELRSTMDEEDTLVFNSLPETITVYRGYQKGKNKSGISWTLDKEKAEWFGGRFSKEKLFATKTIKKDKVLFYSNQRGEQEIVIV